jgi:hypothetical protein
MARPRVGVGGRDLPWERIGRSATRVAAAYLLVALIVTPAVVGWAVASTTVREPIGVSPTTFTLTTAGHSELRLGIAGTIVVPRSRGPFGVVATVDGAADPEASSTDLAAYVSPRMLRLYTGLFHDPERAMQGYVDLLQRQLLHRLLSGELVATAVLGSVFLLVRQLSGSRGRLLPDRTVSAVGIVVLLLLTSAGAGLVQLRLDDSRDNATSADYALPGLEGTPAAGASTNSPVLRLLLEDAVSKIHKLVARQDKSVEAFRRRAETDLRQQSAAGAIAVPRAGEHAVLMQSDMHCNETMIAVQRQVRRLLQEHFREGTLAAMAITGDLTTNGTPAEGACIRDEAEIAGGLPVVAVTGNHESQTSIEQMKDAGMDVLDQSRAKVDDISMLGAADPSRTELFGATALRGDETEEDVGRKLYAAALADPPELVLVHEAYAVAPFVGTDDMVGFLDHRGSATRPYDDRVRDLPASAVLYGHWHRHVPPRVVWNSDKTWTLVMELNTSGGAVAQPTLGHFSTPWSIPQQEASFPVLFLDKATGLVTGYQMFRFATDGTATIEPRVDVGDLGALTAHSTDP